MRPMRKLLLALFLVISLVTASHMWGFNTDGEVSAKPIVYRGNVVVASDDGKIYSLNPFSGLKQWEAEVGMKPNEVFLFDGSVISSVTSGQVTKIGSDGSSLWTVDLNTTDYNASYIYGASSNEKNIYVSANNGIYEIDREGTATNIYNFTDSFVTAPAVGPNYIIFGKEDELFKITETGVEQWSTGMELGSFWLSRPVIQGGIVYIGALDNALHAFSVSNGAEAWQVRTRNWVLSTPLVQPDEGMVYFGSNDGGVYAVNMGTGRIEWVAETQLAIQTQPESGFMGGQPVIFVGGNDKNIYAISKESGDVVWKGPSTGAVGSPLFFENLIIAGSQDRAVNAHSTERACSITQPFEGQLVGKKELVVTGNFVSQAGNARVMVNVNSQQWLEANTSDVEWIYFMDPSLQLSTGLNTISCMVVDSGGQESGPDYTTVTINHDPTQELSDFVIKQPSSIVEGERFTIYVYDGDDGSPLERFTWSLDSAGGSSDKNFSMTLSEPGDHELTVKKIGFNDATQKVTVHASGVNPIFLVVGGLVILIIVWQLWIRVFSKRFSKKKR
jgi:outer membrane protein assembly factor BamB